MVSTIINFITKFMLNNILLIFTVLVLFTAILGIVYANGLHPNNKKVEKIIQKFSSNNYSITYYIAERYLTWLHMRTFFITLNYLLTLVGIIANLLTIFYASIADKNTNEVIIFFFITLYIFYYRKYIYQSLFSFKYGTTCMERA